MTENERNEMLFISDTIKGEINRMCVTDDLSEFDTMYGHAKKHLDKLSKMIYESRFKFSNDPNTTYYDQINEFIRRGDHAKA